MPFQVTPTLSNVIPISSKVRLTTFRGHMLSEVTQMFTKVILMTSKVALMTFRVILIPCKVT